MDNKIIAVLGATGIQGGSVVNTFANDPDTKWHIRAITRNPSSDSAKSLQSKYSNVELVQADANDVASLKRAFAGSNYIFAVTDYWAPFRNEQIRKQHSTGSKPGESLRLWAYDEEIRQGQNIADAAAAQLDADGSSGGLQRFIWSSLPSCKKYSRGKYSRIYHFDSKAVITEYIRDTHPALAEKMSVILIGFYASNMNTSPLMRPIKQHDGSFLIQRLCPPDSLHPFILTHQDTGPFVRALASPRHPSGLTLLAYTAMLSWSQVAMLWAKAVNLPPPQYQEVSLDEFKEQFPVDGEELLSATYSAEFGFAGRDPGVIEPKDLGFKERPEEIEKWFGQQDWSAVLQAEPRM